MPVFSTKRVSRCVRCGHPIPLRVRLEKVEVGGRTCWAHEGCSFPEDLEAAALDHSRAQNAVGQNYAVENDGRGPRVDDMPGHPETVGTLDRRPPASGSGGGDAFADSVDPQGDGLAGDDPDFPGDDAALEAAAHSAPEPGGGCHPSASGGDGAGLNGDSAGLEENGGPGVFGSGAARGPDPHAGGEGGIDLDGVGVDADGCDPDADSQGPEAEDAADRWIPPLGGDDELGDRDPAGAEELDGQGSDGDSDDPELHPEATEGDGQAPEDWSVSDVYDHTPQPDRPTPLPPARNTPSPLPDRPTPSERSGAHQGGQNGDDQPDSGGGPDDLDRLAALVLERIRPQLTEMVADGAARAAVLLRDDLLAVVASQGDDALDQCRGEIVAAVRNAEQAIGKRVSQDVERLVAEAGPREVVHVVRVADALPVRMGDGESFHCAFPEVLELLANGFNVFLPGPTGCGKTHLCRQAATALGLRFMMAAGSEGTTESEFLGTSFPNLSTGENVFVGTPFLDAFENGGLFLLDEIDAMNANCLLKINAAVGNGVCPVPKRPAAPLAVRHQDFRFVVAANTVGNGANRHYCGRNRLDESTLDRFRASTVPMDYDPVLEVKHVCPDKQLYLTLGRWRTKIREHALPRILSTRFVADAYRLSRMGKGVDYIASRIAVGWSRKEQLEVFGQEVLAVRD